MTLAEFKYILSSEPKELSFSLQNGQQVPNHFHLTEIGQINKRFIDCGGTVRQERKVSLQFWEASDFEHRLSPKKFLEIIELSEQSLGVRDYEIEVEYQGIDTISKYGLDFDGERFVLTNLNSACLASDKCGTPTNNQQASNSGNYCSPSSRCC